MCRQRTAPSSRCPSTHVKSRSEALVTWPVTASQLTCGASREAKQHLWVAARSNWPRLRCKAGRNVHSGAGLITAWIKPPTADIKRSRRWVRQHSFVNAVYNGDSIWSAAQCDSCNFCRFGLDLKSIPQVQLAHIVSKGDRDIAQCNQNNSPRRLAEGFRTHA